VCVRVCVCVWCACIRVSVKLASKLNNSQRRTGNIPGKVTVARDNVTPACRRPEVGKIQSNFTVVDSFKPETTRNERWEAVHIVSA
jgi:hypothetical protein